jgi:hypothetical protein
MRYPTLRRDICVFMGLRILLRSDQEQHDSPRQCEAAKCRRNGNPVVLFGGGVDWADVQYLFLVGVIESLIGEAQCAQNH